MPLLHSWWKLFSAYAGLESAGSSSIGAAPPGPIDTEPLLTERKEGSSYRQLAPLAAEGETFLLVTQETWKVLYGWYGGGPVIERPAILVGGGTGYAQKEVQVRPLLGNSMRWDTRLLAADSLRHLPHRQP